MLAGKAIARLVGIDDRRGGGKLSRWQMVIGHQHRNPQGIGPGYTRQAGDPVVYRDNQIRSLLGGQLHDLRGQAIAIVEPVRHQVGDPASTERPQGQDTEAGTGGPVAIIIPQDQDVRIPFQRLMQQAGSRLDTSQ